MRWWRKNKSLVVRLALFALVTQYALQFGHIQQQDIYGAVHPTTAVAGGVVPANDSKPIPSDTKDYCAICAAIVLLSISQVAVAPRLPAQLIAHAIVHVDRPAILFRVQGRSPFQSRAPPAA